MTNGTICSKCGTSLTFKSNTIGLKSPNYESKIHFDIKNIDKIFDKSRDSFRVTNQNYIKVRQPLISFLFEKGALLKISKSSIHCASLIMDIYFEKKGSSIPINDHYLVAACCLLVGSKSAELDDRIPFISKLKKYTSVYADTKSFKRYEVDIALTLDWDLQKITFYDYIEYFLSKAVIVEEDKIFNKIINSKGLENPHKVIEIISKIVNNSSND